MSQLDADPDPGACVFTLQGRGDLDACEQTSRWSPPSAKLMLRHSFPSLVSLSFCVCLPFGSVRDVSENKSMGLELNKGQGDTGRSNIIIWSLAKKIHYHFKIFCRVSKMSQHIKVTTCWNFLWIILPSYLSPARQGTLQKSSHKLNQVNASFASIIFIKGFAKTNSFRIHQFRMWLSPLKTDVMGAPWAQHTHENEPP